MRRIFSLLLSICLALSLCACGQKSETAPEVPTWQEQYDLGIRYLSEGKYEEAILAFEAAIKIDPKRADAYVKAAEAYFTVGDIESLINILTEGAEISGDDSLLAYLEQLLNGGYGGDDPEELVEQMLQGPGALSYADLPEVFGMNYDGLGGVLGQELMSSQEHLDGRMAYVNGTQLEIPLRGAVYHVFNEEVGSVCYSRAYAPPGNSQWTNLHVARSLKDGELAYGHSTGWKDIRTGDTVAQVLEKLGLPTVAEALTEYNPDYGSLFIWLYKDREPRVYVQNEIGRGLNNEPARSVSIYFVEEEWTERDGQVVEDGSGGEVKNISRRVNMLFEHMEYLYEIEYIDEVALMALVGE